MPVTLQKAVIEAIHCSVACHLGFTKCLNFLKPKFTWPGLYNDLKSYINSCDVCLKAKSTHKKEQVPRALYEYAGTPFIRIHLDLVGPMCKSKKGHIWILTCCDSFSGYCIAVPLRNATSESLAVALNEHLICKHGAPLIFHTDNAQNFISKVFQGL